MNDQDLSGKLEEKKLGIEADDRYKASTIFIQPLAIKAVPGTLYSSSIKSMLGEVGQFSISLPERIYLTFNFFDFPPYKTDVLSF